VQVQKEQRKQPLKRKFESVSKKKKDSETTETSTTTTPTPTPTKSGRTKETARKSTSPASKTTLKPYSTKPAIHVTPLNQRSPAKTPTHERTPTPTPTPPNIEGTTELSPGIYPVVSPEIQPTTTAIVVANMEEETEEPEASKGPVNKVEKTTKSRANEKGKTKRKQTETESPVAKTRSASKKQRLEGEEEKKKKVEKEKKMKVETVTGKRKRVVKEKKKVEKKKKVAEDDMDDEEAIVEKKKDKGKKNVEEEDTSDEDFVVEVKKDEKKGKKKMEEEEDEDDAEGTEKRFKSLRAKTTVKPFYAATKKLSPERKQRVREMGFGSLLGFPYNMIPTKLPYFILKNLNVDTMEVKLPNGGVIKITPRKIREVLGIPMGPIPFYAENKRLTQDSVYCQFLAELPKDYRKRKTTTLSTLIQTTQGTDFIFELNYLMLFANCLGSCGNTAMLKYDVLENVKSSKDIPNIDWCTFIWNCMKESKEKWDDTTKENWYYGPHVTFTVSNTLL